MKGFSKFRCGCTHGFEDTTTFFYLSVAVLLFNSISLIQMFMLFWVRTLKCSLNSLFPLQTLVHGTLHESTTTAYYSSRRVCFLLTRDCEFWSILHQWIRVSVRVYNFHFTSEPGFLIHEYSPRLRTWNLQSKTVIQLVVLFLWSESVSTLASLLQNQI